MPLWQRWQWWQWWQLLQLRLVPPSNYGNTWITLPPSHIARVLSCPKLSLGKGKSEADGPNHTLTKFLKKTFRPCWMWLALLSSSGIISRGAAKHLPKHDFKLTRKLQRTNTRRCAVGVFEESVTNPIRNGLSWFQIRFRFPSRALSHRWRYRCRCRCRCLSLVKGCSLG